jgi:putative endonuclease
MFGAKHSKIEVGADGEKIASLFLLRLGYKILYRNHREGIYEIDIIAKSSENRLIFVEVKTFLIKDKRNIKPAPEDNFTRFKFNKTMRACEKFIAKHPNIIDTGAGWRIDLVAITLTENGKISIKHFKNVVLN